jgi:hypothetical protein
MVQALMDRVQALAGGWDVVVVEAEWVGTALGQVPAGTVYAPVVEQRFLIRQVFLAMMQAALSAGPK